MTEITFKVLPAPEESKTLIIHEQKIESATNFLDKATNSSSDISGATFFPMDSKVIGCQMNIEKTFKLNDLKHKGSLTAIIIEGSKNSIDERIKGAEKDPTYLMAPVNIISSYKVYNLNPQKD